MNIDIIVIKYNVAKQSVNDAIAKKIMFIYLNTLKLFL
jgi:hypothetical protein